MGGRGSDSLPCNDPSQRRRREPGFVESHTPPPFLLWSRPLAMGQWPAPWATSNLARKRRGELHWLPLQKSSSPLSNDTGRPLKRSGDGILILRTDRGRTKKSRLLVPRYMTWGIEPFLCAGNYSRLGVGLRLARCGLQGHVSYAAGYCSLSLPVENGFCIESLAFLCSPQPIHCWHPICLGIDWAFHLLDTCPEKSTFAQPSLFVFWWRMRRSVRWNP